MENYSFQVQVLQWNGEEKQLREFLPSHADICRGSLTSDKVEIINQPGFPNGTRAQMLRLLNGHCLLKYENGWMSVKTREQLEALGVKLKEQEPKSNAVYSDPACVYTYCPHPETCKALGCRHKSGKPDEARD